MKPPRCLLPFLALLVLAGCASNRVGRPLPRRGDEIVVAGQFFHTGTPVVLWMDPGGYDAYRVERRFSPPEKAGWEASKAEVKALSTPNRLDLRREALSPEELERFRGGGWDLPAVQRVVDQFVLHYDVCGTSRQCFRVLHDQRGLSVHFMLDLDGTIYQTMDVKERGRHATIANTRSVGVEIANMGAYGPEEANPFAEWYRREPDGRARITIPAAFGDGGIRTPNFIGYAARPEPVAGVVQQRSLRQYDFTLQQYEALARLTAALCRVLPKLKCDYPRDAKGGLIPQKLPDDQLARFQGVLAHYHIQANKPDPGPAFQWDRVIDGARRLLGLAPLARAGR